jgi:hypothetical protein
MAALYHVARFSHSRLPRVVREDVILPAGVLERIERHTIVFAKQAERLLAAGRSLKRGLLLYGPPGVGKTLTVLYLSGRMAGRTIILTAGLAMGLLQPPCSWRGCSRRRWWSSRTST